jgi:hypothetical protein
LKIDSVDQKLFKIQLTCGNFSQGAGTPYAQRDIALSHLAVKELKKAYTTGMQ